MLYIGDSSGKAKSTNAIYVGDSTGKSRRVVTIYQGDANGKAKVVYSSAPPDIDLINYSYWQYSSDVSINGAEMYIYAPASSYGYTISCSSISIDLTKYKKIVIEGYGKFYNLTFYDGANYTSLLNSDSSVVNFSRTIDISSVTGSKTLRIGGEASPNGGYTYITKLILTN